MNALGVTFDNQNAYWRGRPLEDVLGDFLHDDAVLAAYPTLRQFDRLRLRVSLRYADEESIGLHCVGARGIVEFRTALRSDAAEYFISDDGDSESLFDLMNVRRYLRLIDDLTAAENSARALRAKNADLERENIALKSENAALRLLPGAPEYFHARDHFEELAAKK